MSRAVLLCIALALAACERGGHASSAPPDAAPATPGPASTAVMRSSPDAGCAPSKRAIDLITPDQGCKKTRP